MVDGRQMAFIRRKTRLRFTFTGLTLLLYFSFVLNWLPVGRWLNEPIGESMVTGSLLYFVGLIVTFIALELVFLLLYKREREKEE